MLISCPKRLGSLSLFSGKESDGQRNVGGGNQVWCPHTSKSVFTGSLVSVGVVWVIACVSAVGEGAICQKQADKMTALA